MENKREHYEEFNINSRIIELAKTAENTVKDSFDQINYVKEQNQLKVIRAMQRERLSDTHFSGTTGYGYNDRGEDSRRRLCSCVPGRGCFSQT